MNYHHRREANKYRYVKHIGKAKLHPSDCDHPATVTTETVVGDFEQCRDCRVIL